MGFFFSNWQNRLSDSSSATSGTEKENEESKKKIETADVIAKMQYVPAENIVLRELSRGVISEEQYDVRLEELNNYDHFILKIGEKSSRSWPFPGIKNKITKAKI